MSYSALIQHFSEVEDLPIPVDEVINWIRRNTEHRNILLHRVNREHKAFRGILRRTAMPSTTPYNTEPEILNCIIYGSDLSEDWQRLVVVKELTHLFDNDSARVRTADDVKKLIPAMIVPEFRGTEFAPALNDHFGPFRAMAILIPEKARRKLQEASSSGRRTTEEIADYCKLPLVYVDTWMKYGDRITELIVK